MAKLPVKKISNPWIRRPAIIISYPFMALAVAVLQVASALTYAQWRLLKTARKVW